MASKRIQRGGNAVLYSVLAIGILVLINLVASRKFSRADLTQEQIYTISEASKKMVAALPDRLTIKAFISADLPPQVTQIARYLRDMLDEYATYSKGRIVWESIDPTGNDKAKEEARRLKVSEAQLGVLEKTKRSVSQAFLGVAFQYGGKVESIPFVSDMATLEYQISSTIRRLVGNKRKIGFTSGHGEPSLYQGLGAAREALKDYEVTTVELAEGKTPIPQDVDVLVMVGPTQPFAERAKYELDQYLMRGKAAAFFLDGMVLETPRGQMPPGQQPPRIARANNVGLRDQLEHYGLKLNEDLVMDRQNVAVWVPVGQGQQVAMNYPAYPRITNLSRVSPITRSLREFVAIFPSSLELTPAVREGKSGVTGTVLATCSPASWRQTGFFVFDPLRPPEPTKDLGPFNLAYSLQGALPSFFEGRPVPAPGPAKPQAGTETKPRRGKTAPPSTRIVAVSDGELVQDGRMIPANMLLLQNTIDYLAEDESLISIRAKAQTSRPLREVEESTVALAKYGNIIGLPLAFILFGIGRWRWRRISRQRRAQDIIKGS